MTKRQKLAFALIVSLVMTGGGFAFGQSSNTLSNKQTIYACVSSANGSIVKLSNTLKACPKGTSRLSWNSEGIRGEQGIQGVKGDSGIAGPQGIRGEQGIPGVKGDSGITGPQGIQGPKGEGVDKTYAGLWARSDDGRVFKIVQLKDDLLTYLYQDQLFYFPIQQPGESKDLLATRASKNFEGNANYVVYRTQDCTGDPYIFYGKTTNPIKDKMGLGVQQVLTSPDFPQPQVKSKVQTVGPLAGSGYSQSTATLTEFNLLSGLSYMTFGYGDLSLGNKFGILAPGSFNDLKQNGAYVTGPSYGYSYSNTTNYCHAIDWQAEINWYVRWQKSQYPNSNIDGAAEFLAKKSELEALNLWRLEDGIDPEVSNLELITD